MATTPNRNVKAEYENASDIYNATPRSCADRIPSLAPRYRSKSTAQLSTPVASPNTKRERHSSIESNEAIKSEISQIIVRTEPCHYDVCTPPISSPEINTSAIRKIREVLKERKENSDTVLKNGTETRLGQKVSIHGGNHKPEAKTTNASTTPRPEPQPILPPPKVLRSGSKTMSSTPVSNAGSLVNNSTTKCPTPAGDSNANKKACCNLMCSHCTPKAVWEEYGLGPPKSRPHIPAVKSVSLCPSSVSSFGPNDDIPSPQKMREEAGKIIVESTRTVTSKQLSRVPQSENSQSKLRLVEPSEKNKDTDVYNDFAANDILGTPQRAAIHKALEQLAGRTHKDVDQWRQGCDKVKKAVSEYKDVVRSRPCRSLRSQSNTQNDLGKKLQVVDIEEEVGQIEQNFAEESSSEDVEDQEDNQHDSDSEPETPSEARSEIRGTKRARASIDSWQPQMFDDYAMSDCDDLMEIDKDVFEQSENKRQKRNKNDTQVVREETSLSNSISKGETVARNEHIPGPDADCDSAAVPPDEVSGKLHYFRTEAQI